MCSTIANTRAARVDRLFPDVSPSMADIRIARPHGLPLSRAKAAAQAAADDLAREYALTYQWQGDSVHFQRSGVQGRIEVNATQIAVEIRLGLLLKGFKRAIEQSVNRHLDQLLAQGGAVVAQDVPPEGAVVIAADSPDAGAGGQEAQKVPADTYPFNPSTNAI
jgi:putative polyhydroxyalkanoate system protein